MKFTQRAARFAALTLSLTGFVSASSVGHASEVERNLAPSALSTSVNLPAVASVPLPAPVPIPAVLPSTAVDAAPKASFASLSDAVAAQDGAIDEEPIRCLAGAVYFESKGEPLAGQLAVAQVIINRSRSGRFASDVCGVVKQRGQFSFVRGGQIPSVGTGTLAYRTAVAVAKVALGDMCDDDPAPQALYFNGAHASHSGTRRVALIGHHAFYR